MKNPSSSPESENNSSPGFLAWLRDKFKSLFGFSSPESSEEPEKISIITRIRKSIASLFGIEEETSTSEKPSSPDLQEKLKQVESTYLNKQVPLFFTHPDPQKGGEHYTTAECEQVYSDPATQKIFLTLRYTVDMMPITQDFPLEKIEDFYHRRNLTPGTPLQNPLDLPTEPSSPESDSESDSDSSPEKVSTYLKQNFPIGYQAFAPDSKNNKTLGTIVEHHPSATPATVSVAVIDEDSPSGIFLSTLPALTSSHNSEPSLTQLNPSGLTTPDPQKVVMSYKPGTTFTLEEKEYKIENIYFNNICRLVSSSGEVKYYLSERLPRPPKK